MKSKQLQDYPVFHAGVKKARHDELGVDINVQTSVRYLRFLRNVSIDRLELPLHVYGRATPKVPVHPARIAISVLDKKNLCWSTVKQVDLPPRESISGKCLNQNMSGKEMDEYFKKVLHEEPPYIFDTGGIETDHLRVECDREHHVWPNHGECNGGPYNVPFGILNPLQAFGTEIGAEPDNRGYQKALYVKKLKPSAPRQMSLKTLPHMIMYSGKFFSVGFSLVRPMLFHLGWDFHGGNLSAVNRLLTVRHYHVQKLLGGLSGPLLRTLASDSPCWFWDGEISIEGEKITYSNLNCGEGITIDASFFVRNDGMSLEISTKSERPVPALEWGSWRFLWDLEKGITSTAGLPAMTEGRNGVVKTPALFTGSGVGSLACRKVRGDNFRIQTESYRYQWKNCRSDDIIQAPPPEQQSPLVVPLGGQRTEIIFSLENILPEVSGENKDIPLSIAKTWSSVFTSFRPEKGGFSNNANSVNCHVNQVVSADLVPFTKRSKDSPDPLALARFTVERAILDGGGYGYHRGLYLDSDPILLSAAGRIFQKEGDLRWLKYIRQGLIDANRRIVSLIGKEGLIVSRELTGNSGTYRWSTNAMDCIGYGHMDAYVNAWCYRALKNTAAMFRATGDENLAVESGQAAEKIRSVYAKYLLNPETGWVAGWRSLDNNLHDAAYLWVNGPACAFGLLGQKDARTALENMESLRRRVGPESAYFGLPLNLMPVPKEDTIYSLYYYPMDTPFEGFTNGCLYPGSIVYYIRALSVHGMDKEAEKIVSELEEGYSDMVFNGRFKEGFEFYAWDGCETGYEGTFGPAFTGLYAIAVQRGIIKPPEPEWWPA